MSDGWKVFWAFAIFIWLTGWVNPYAGTVFFLMALYFGGKEK